LFDFLLLSLLFIPGILLLLGLSKKIKLDFLEKVLFGSVIWNYLFISSTVLLGITTNLVVLYFEFFQLISIAIIIIACMLLVKNVKKITIPKIKLNLTVVPRLVVLLAVLILCFLLIYFHTIFVEWDAVSYYIPSAKSILVSQGLTSQPYRQLGFFDSSPSIPAIFAWLINLSSIDSLYTIPIAYFALTSIVIFLIFRRLFPKRSSTIPIMIFASLPTVLVTISSRALYLDMPFMLFLLSTLYSAIRIATAKSDGNNTKFDYVMFSIGLTLLCLTRIEFGLFLFPVAIITILFTLKIKGWQIIAFSAIGMVYYAREIRNILLNQSSWFSYLQRLIPVIIVSFLVFIILRKLSFENNQAKKLVNKKFVVATLLLTTPLIAYLLSNIIISGFITPALPINNSEIVQSAEFFNQISPPLTISWIESLRWDNIVTVWWLISPYLIPITISLFWILKRLTKKELSQSLFVPLLFFSAGLFILWSILYCDPQPRRLYYFAPLVAIIASDGLFKIKKYFSSTGFALRVPTYIIAITAYTLAKLGIDSVNDLALSYKPLYLPTADILFLLVSVLFFLIIFIPYETLLPRIRKKINPPSISPKIVTLLALGLNLIIVMPIFCPVISSTLKTGYQSRSQDYNLWYYYPEVVNYYNENVTDNGVTVGYFCNELITFSNRSVIDLFNPVYGMPIYTIVNSSDETEILNRLEELNVRYFLVPNKGTYFYPYYEGLINNTAFGNILSDNPQYYVLKSFVSFTLYRYDSNYQNLAYSVAIPWNYNHAKNFTMTTKKNSTEFSGSTTANGHFY